MSERPGLSRTNGICCRADFDTEAVPRYVRDDEPLDAMRAAFFDVGSLNASGLSNPLPLLPSPTCHLHLHREAHRRLSYIYQSMCFRLRPGLRDIHSKTSEHVL